MLTLEGMMNALGVGERLAEIRKSRKISQAKFAPRRRRRYDPELRARTQRAEHNAPPCGIHLPAQSATDSVPAGRANRQAGADTQCRRLSFVGWSLRICFSFNAGQWVVRPLCPAAQAANFDLLDLQLTEADRRPFKLPLQLGELPIEPVEERPQARCGLRRSRPCADARHRQTVNEWPVPTRSP